MNTDKVYVLDSNILIRFLVADEPEHAFLVENLFSQAKKGTLYVPDIIFSEVVYVLTKAYKFDKSEVVDALSQLLNFEFLRINRSLLGESLDIFKSKNISFNDAYLIALINVGQADNVITFDKAIGRADPEDVINPS